MPVNMLTGQPLLELKDQPQFRKIKYQFTILEYKFLGFKPDPLLPDNEFPLAHFYIYYCVEGITANGKNGKVINFKQYNELYYMGCAPDQFFSIYPMIFVSGLHDSNADVKTIEFTMRVVTENFNIVYQPTPNMLPCIVKPFMEDDQSSEVKSLSLMVTNRTSLYPNIHHDEFKEGDHFAQGTFSIMSCKDDVLVTEMNDKKQFTSLVDDIAYFRFKKSNEETDQMTFHFDLTPSSAKLELFPVEWKYDHSF